MQKKWSVDGEVQDQIKRQWMRVLIYIVGAVAVLGLMQLFLFFNPPPPGIDRGPPPQTQR